LILGSKLVLEWLVEVLVLDILDRLILGSKLVLEWLVEVLVLDISGRLIPGNRPVELALMVMGSMLVVVMV